MNTKIEQIEKAILTIEYKVGTEWLEKWVHEIKELEFATAPTKNYSELWKRIPPMAVVWCKARDELTMSSITGNVESGEVLLKAYKIGINLSECVNLPGFNEQIDLLKSKDTHIFQESCYSLAVASGYKGLGYQPLLRNGLIVDHQGIPVQALCRAGLMLSPADLELHKFWSALSMELGRRLTFYGVSQAVLITAEGKPQPADVMDIINEVSPKISNKDNHVELDFELNSKYKVHITPLDGTAQQRNEASIPSKYEFGTVIGSSVVALNLVQNSDRETAIINECTLANNLADKKIPTTLYVDIPVSQAEDTRVLLTYYTKQIAEKYISHYENLSQIILTARFLKRDKLGLSQAYLSDSVKNGYAKKTLPEGFTPFMPGNAEV